MTKKPHRSTRALKHYLPGGLMHRNNDDISNLDVISSKADLIHRLQEALGTEENGFALVEVARNAHRAEQRFAGKPFLELLAHYVSGDDHLLDRVTFLQAVTDRIKDDILNNAYLNCWEVKLFNEDGEPLQYTIRATAAKLAIIEAWRLYRELPYIDNEEPPDWAKAKVE